MAHWRVGVYRKYLEPVPRDAAGQPVPKRDWPRKRRFCWVARWFGASKKRYSRRFDTKAAAREFAEDKQAQLRRAYLRQGRSVTLLEFYQEHERVMPGNVADGTLALHLSAWRMFAGFVGWELFVHDITAPDIERFRAARMATSITPATANQNLQILHRLFNLAIVRGYRAKGTNPCAGLPRLRVGAIQIRVMSPETYAKVYAVAPDSYWRAFLATLYTTGLRRSEVLNLTWSDLDLTERRLVVTRKKAAGFVQAWSPKDHEIRTIPLPSQTLYLLRAWRSIAPEECPYVFMEPARWRYYREEAEQGKWRSGRDLVNNLLRRFQTLCRKVEVEPYTLHDLRRSCITNWARSVPMHVVQQMAGHSEMRTTRRYYLLVEAEDLERAGQAQEALLDAVPAEHLAEPELKESARQRVFPGPQGRCQPPQLAATP